jgi:hypothetical protein
MKTFFAVLIALSFSGSAFAKKDSAAEKQKLIDKMVSACKAELAKDPALAETSDGETVWRNLEDKEHANVKFAKNCHVAHEKYEHKYHKDEEHEEGEKY